MHMTKWIMTVVLLLSACSDPMVEKVKYDGIGTVRSLWQGQCNAGLSGGCHWTVVFEEDGSRRMLSLHGYGSNAPPVWVGMHCELKQITMHDSQGDGIYKWFEAIRKEGK